MSPSSIIAILRRLFPEIEPSGTPPYAAFPTRDGELPLPYATPPVLPPDAFAIAGHLLELSGAFHHVVPDVPERASRQARQVVITAMDIARTRAVAHAWREFDPAGHYDPDAPGRFTAWLAGEGAPIGSLFEWWRELFDVHAASPVYVVMDPVAAAPPWWKSALMMLMAADEAFAGFGYQISGLGNEGNADDAASAPGTWMSTVTQYRMAQALSGQMQNPDPAAGGALLEGIASISSASPDIVAVVPKARTAAVGCTMRSLSHHLALLPPRGIAKASWIPFLSDRVVPDSRQMNLLLVPFPFSIPAQAFHARSHFAGRGIRLGFFELEQTWLRGVTAANVVDFVKALAEQAEKECGHIHGVVFPEMALNQNLFSEVSRGLPAVLPELEILVAGQSGETGSGRRPGNFVSMAVYHEKGTEDPRSFISRREKHHRWKIDRSQILA